MINLASACFCTSGWEKQLLAIQIVKRLERKWFLFISYPIRDRLFYSLKEASTRGGGISTFSLYEFNEITLDLDPWYI
jgi:hypothetical protein